MQQKWLIKVTLIFEQNVWPKLLFLPQALCSQLWSRQTGLCIFCMFWLICKGKCYSLSGFRSIFGAAASWCYISLHPRLWWLQRNKLRQRLWISTETILVERRNVPLRLFSLSGWGHWIKTAMSAVGELNRWDERLRSAR